MSKRNRKRQYDIVDPVCNHCWKELRLTTGKEIYPHRSDLWMKQYWVCDPCNARVGCHPNSNHALGYAANAELRNARSHVHGILDPLWKPFKGSNGAKQSYMTRSEVYKTLSERMKLPRAETHISMFKIEDCREAYVILKDMTKVNTL